MAEAQAHPDQLFSVIVQGKPGTKSSSVANAVVESTDARPGKAKGLKRTFSSVNGVAAQLTGAQIVELARPEGHPRDHPGLEDSTVRGERRLLQQPDLGQRGRRSGRLERHAAASGDRGRRLRRAGVPGRLQRHRRRLQHPRGRQGDHDEPASELERRRARARHARGRPRRGLARRIRRRRADGTDRLDRRHGRQRHGDDERRHRCGRLDPREQERATTSASRTSRCSRRSPAASCTTRSTRRSRSSGSTAWSSSLPPATTA